MILLPGDGDDDGDDDDDDASVDDDADDVVVAAVVVVDAVVVDGQYENTNPLLTIFVPVRLQRRNRSCRDDPSW